MWAAQNEAKNERRVILSQLRRYVLLPLLATLLFVTLSSSSVHALNETYTLTESTSRLQESSTARVLLALNVSNANTLTNYAFTWHVKDPSGAMFQANNQTSAPHSASFVESVAYPGKFGTTASLDLVGSYLAWVNQTQPPLVGSTGVGTPVQFQVGLTDTLSYQRTLPVAIKATGYKPSLNVTISISGQSGPAPNFPTNKLADSNGNLSYVWSSIPASIPVGNWTVSLSGNPTKSPPDVQSFTILPANVTISALTLSRSILQASQTEDFRFSATYPNGSRVKTGGASLLVVEADGSTSDYVAMSYSNALNVFHGTYQIPLSSQFGPWVATVEVNTFDDAHGNKGPVSGVFKPFTVTPAILAVSVITASSNYTVSDIVPAGFWQIQVNATDTYGNAGQGSTSTLVSIPISPQQSSTFNYLLIAAIVLMVALAVLVSWVIYGRKRVLRRVLKVDIEAIHAEAKKVENQDFFKKVQEQLKQQRKEKADGTHAG